jgi:AcrR family transcriptional regulator
VPTDIFLRLSEEKRKRVFDAAVTEFSERDITEANLSNIAKSSDIARGSLYQYFTTKEELYIYIFEAMRAGRSEYVKPAFELYKKAPFMDFFQEFYLRDSMYLLEHPQHIELGKKLYSANDSVSRGLVSSLQSRYHDLFLVAIDYDKERGFISNETDSSILADLCVHFATDIFIFQNIHACFSIFNIREHTEKTLGLLKRGTNPR